MTLPIRTLPIVERWDCHACGNCCRGPIIRLSDDELKRIREQRWHEHPEYRGVRILRRDGLLRRRYRLAHRRDGTCVFLTADGRCRIHSDHGEAAKPSSCRMFPLQLVPLEGFAYLTLRRYCPSAAADSGRTLKEHLRAARKLAEEHHLAPEGTRPPAVVRGHRRGWKDTLRIAEIIERLILDGRYPPVRRLAHGVQFCDLLQACRLGKVSGDRLGPLLGMLETSAVEEASGLFAEREPPGKAAASLFRQTAFDYLRLHPKIALRESWRERLRLLRRAIAFGRGKGRVPPMHLDFPETTFAELERPLGHLGAEVLQPLGRYFEVAAASKHYALLGRRSWPLVESFRALAASYSVAMWILRLTCGQRPPAVEDVIDAVAAIDRGQGYGPLVGRRHRVRISTLAGSGELPRLLAWYAR